MYNIHEHILYRFSGILGIMGENINKLAYNPKNKKEIKKNIWIFFIYDIWHLRKVIILYKFQLTTSLKTMVRIFVLTSCMDIIYWFQVFWYKRTMKLLEGERIHMKTIGDTHKWVHLSYFFFLLHRKV